MQAERRTVERRRFTVDEMSEASIFREDDRVELIDGEVEGLASEALPGLLVPVDDASGE